MDIAKEEKRISSLMEWERSKKLLFVAAILFGVMSSIGSNFALTNLGSHMAAELGAPELFSLVFTISMFVQVVFQPACNQLTRKIGIGNVLIFSEIITAIHCVMIIIAPSMEMVIVARCLAAIGMAFIMAAGMGSYPLMFDGPECAKWNGMYGTAMSLSLCVFPLLGGIMFDLWGNWQLTFVLCAICGVVSTVLSFIAKPPRYAEPQGDEPFDGAGMISLGICLAAFLYLVTFGGVQFPWISAITLGLVAVMVISIVAFIKVEGKKGDAAIIPLRLFKHRGFTVALLAGLLISIPDCIMVTYLPTYAQAALGHNATIGGLFSSVPGVLAIFASAAFGILLEKKGCYRALFTFSAALATIAVFGMIQFDASSNIWFVIAFMTATWGTAYSIFKFIPGAIVQAKTPAEDAPICTNTVLNALTLGSTLGLAFASIPLAMFANDMVLAFNYVFIIALVGCIAATIVVVVGLKGLK